MAEIIDINDKRVEVIHGDDFNEDVCEHCLGGVFKEGAPTGKCKIGPPHAGIVIIPTQVTPSPANPSGIQMMASEYSVFPQVERREFCLAWEPKEDET